jgi:hypothetical protein
VTLLPVPVTVVARPGDQVEVLSGPDGESTSGIALSQNGIVCQESSHRVEGRFVVTYLAKRAGTVELRSFETVSNPRLAQLIFQGLITVQKAG